MNSTAIADEVMVKKCAAFMRPARCKDLNRLPRVPPENTVLPTLPPLVVLEVALHLGLRPRPSNAWVAVFCENDTPGCYLKFINGYYHVLAIPKTVT
jgi:hypothetical protein